MRIYCPECQKKAIIRSSRDESTTLRTLYCMCSNPLCGHSFTMELAFVRTLSPSAFCLPKEVREALPHMTRHEVKSLFSLLAP